jgi:hypothetical protein
MRWSKFMVGQGQVCFIVNKHTISILFCSRGDPGKKIEMTRISLANRRTTMDKLHARALVNAEWDGRENRLMNKGKVLVHDNQKDYAQQAFRAFLSGVSLVSLVASCQMGKTGAALYLMKLMTTHPDDEVMIHPDNVFMISAMSDKDWKSQTKKRVLPCFQPRVWHRNDLSLMLRTIRGKHGCLIVIDECHYGNEKEQTLHKILKESGIWDIDYMRSHNIKILCMSATPGHVLVDAQNWGDDHHKTIVAADTDGSYTSFRHLLDEGRVIAADLAKPPQVVEVLDAIAARWDSPKYHIVRASEKTLEKGCVKDRLVERGFHWTMHNSQDRIRNIEKMLGNAPSAHHFIFIKGFWRAAKTLDDSHIGVCYEGSKDYSACVQGLAGRLLGYGRQRGSQAPLLYCHVRAIQEYADWLDNGANYYLCEKYASKNLKVRRGVIVKKEDSALDPQEVHLDAIDSNLKQMSRALPVRVKVVSAPPQGACVATTCKEMTADEFQAAFGLKKLPKTCVALSNQLKKSGISANVSFAANAARDVANLVNYYRHPEWASGEHHVVKLGKADTYTVIKKDASVLSSCIGCRGKQVVIHDYKGDLVLYAF